MATYWLTGTAGSAIRFYYEDAHHAEQPDGPTTVPTGLAMFGGDFESIRRFCERDHSALVSWHNYADVPGGHYAAHAATDILVTDVRDFFTSLAGRS